MKSKEFSYQPSGAQNFEENVCPSDVGGTAKLVRKITI
jgi:hypothetical protein